MIKKALLTFATFTALSIGASADEGMWLLPLLQKMNGQAMSELGCKLTPDQIYNINNSSLKDAIVQFGGGCTGEMISQEGLLVTNHHCGYSSIQRLSTPEHNYLEDGYWAMNRNQELPVKGLTVTFLQSMTDVTDIINKAEASARKANKGNDNIEKSVEEAIDKAMADLEDKAVSANENCTADVIQFYNQNVYYLIVYKVYKDVRFVGAPPASIGKFGGETDNWMWPRQTGDFSMFRVYADKNNEPSEYSEDNIPYTPKQSLKISLKGVNDGDFTFIMGYPGRTQRFQTADQLESMIGVNNVRVAARTCHQNVMLEGMESDPVIRLQYANKYAGSANGWKKWQGMQLAFDKLGIISREKQKEADFMVWVNKNNKRTEKYGSALEDISTFVNNTSEAQKDIALLTETLYKIGPVSNVASFIRSFRVSLRNTKDTTASANAGIDAVTALYKDYNDALERKMAVALLEYYRTNAKAENYPDYGQDFSKIDFSAFVDNLFDASAFTSADKTQALKGKSYDEILKDPMIDFYNQTLAPLRNLYPKLDLGADKFAKGTKDFSAGLLEWKKNEPSYPDANFTMRLTYGTVKSYSPKDGVLYKHYTTLDGVMEKEDPNNYEFKVPARLKELWKNKDFGQYANAEGKVPTCFLTNNDITGGNSGSPVLNANGELIGLAFDGNWESMSSDVMFEPELQRCICVDIRYVLFLMDKFGGAGYLLDEMNIVR